MAKARIGHFVEAQILEAIGIEYVDQSEVLTLADDQNHINKHKFWISFVCGCRNLGEALRRIRERAAMIRTKGEAGTGNIIEVVRHVRSVMRDIRVLRNMDDDEVFTFAKKIAAPYDFVMQTKQLGRLPVVHFAAGGVATPADVALMTRIGHNFPNRKTLGIGLSRLISAVPVGFCEDKCLRSFHLNVVAGAESFCESLGYNDTQVEVLLWQVTFHGHWCYKRISKMILYFVYKNVAFGLTLFCYKVYTSFSGEVLYDDL